MYARFWIFWILPKCCKKNDIAIATSLRPSCRHFGFVNSFTIYAYIFTCHSGLVVAILGLWTTFQFMHASLRVTACWWNGKLCVCFLEYPTSLFWICHSFKVQSLIFSVTSHLFIFQFWNWCQILKSCIPASTLNLSFLLPLSPLTYYRNILLNLGFKT